MNTSRARLWTILVALLAVVAVLAALVGWLYRGPMLGALLGLLVVLLWPVVVYVGRGIATELPAPTARHAAAGEERNGEDPDAYLRRLGETLTRTLDLDGILSVVLATALSSVRASSGVVLMVEPTGDLRLVAGQGLDRLDGSASVRGVTLGSGVLGGVASTGIVARGRLESLMPAPGEPSIGNVLAVPLRRHDDVIGVLAAYDRLDRQAFSESDEDALKTLADQASVAVDNALQHSEAQTLAVTDALTGRWNYRYLSMNLGREIERALRFGRHLAVVMLDLDHFKEVNDRYGHERGNAVLREFTDRVGEQIREIDTLARYGGEEFVLILPETGLDGAQHVAERICGEIRGTPFTRGGGDWLWVTVSAGIAVFPEHGANQEQLLRAADAALYQAKRGGRDRWSVADVELRSER
jgi:two-component system, cell cycle response regulator